MTFEQYLAAVETCRRAYPEWRYGQCAFNVLTEVQPSLAEQVRGTGLDPFYQDGRLEQFTNYVQEHWE